MSHSEWLAQLEQLRNDRASTPSQSMWMKWHYYKEHQYFRRGWAMYLNRKDPIRTMIYLYKDPPEPNDFPVVRTEILDSDAIGKVTSGLLVTVYGWPQPGGALHIELPSGERLRAAGPARGVSRRAYQWRRIP